MLVLLVSNSDVWQQEAELLRITSTQLFRSLAGNARKIYPLWSS
ncbi:hypothetical protein [Nostoc sp.]